jgi:hypothetical protein
MPERMGTLRAAFGLGKPDLTKLNAFGVIKAGTAVGNPGALFPRVELKKEELAGQ